MEGECITIRERKKRRNKTVEPTRREGGREGGTKGGSGGRHIPGRAAILTDFCDAKVSSPPSLPPFFLFLFLFCNITGGQDGVRVLSAGILYVRALLPVRGRGGGREGWERGEGVLQVCFL